MQQGPAVSAPQPLHCSSAVRTQLWSQVTVQQNGLTVQTASQHVPSLQ
jgi:hypothetical protein